MAKIMITLQDSRNNSGKPTVSMDMLGVPRGTASAAFLIANMLWGMASSEQLLGELPAHRCQPSNATLH